MSSCLQAGDGTTYRGSAWAASSAKRSRSSSSETVDCSPPRSRTASAASDSRSPYTTVNGTFCSSASRIRLPSVSSRSSISTR